MRQTPIRRFNRIGPILFGSLLAGGMLGCGGGAEGLNSLLGTSLFPSGSTSSSGSSGSSNSSSGSGSSSGSATDADPNTLSVEKKLIRISMRNLSSDTVHYFLLMVGFVRGDAYPTGGVSASDIAFYTNQANGYTEIPAGQTVAFGNYCINGPAVYRFHLNGQFKGGGGKLASAIGPAQGTTPTYDNYFTSAGAQVAVPDVILFHNPGTGDGQDLQLAFTNPTPCAAGTLLGASNCGQDAWYYVDEQDLPSGSNSGADAYVRYPNGIQGTGCQCGGAPASFGVADQLVSGVAFSAQAGQLRAPSGLSASSAQCNQFFRGGRIDYVFLRNTDILPTPPQLVWKVTDGSGATAHTFDPRSGVP